MHVICRLLILFETIFLKFLSGMPLKYQTVWIQIRPDVLLALSGFKLFAKGKNDDTSRQRVNGTRKSGQSPERKFHCTVIFH